MTINITSHQQLVDDRPAEDPDRTIVPRSAHAAETVSSPLAFERRRSRRVATMRVAAGAVLVSSVVSAAVLAATDERSAPPRAVEVVDVDAVTRRLVEQGVIPSQSLEPSSPGPAARLDVEAVTRRLVEQGVIPAQSLESPASSDSAG